MDLTNETFTGSDEMVGIANRAIDKAEAHVHKLGMQAEYFLNSAALSLVSGTKAYSFPADIYGQMIREIVYRNGAELYPVVEIPKNLKNKFSYIENRDNNDTNADYKFWIKHADATTGYQIVLSPAARTTSSTIMTVYYIRNATRIPLVTGGSLSASRAIKMDIPEARNFLLADMKCQIAAKEVGHPLMAAYDMDRERELELMINTMSEQTATNQTEIEPDTRHYMESS